MKRVNQYQFYQLGHVIHPLTEVAPTATVGDVWISLLGAQTWLNFILEDSLTPIVTCRSPAVRLLKAIEQVLPKASAEDVSPEQRRKEWADQLEQPLSWYSRQEISIAAKEFETVFGAELETTDTYYVSEKGIYATSRLIEAADRIFSPDVRAEIPPQGISDIQQAGKCLAFDLDTASGFHIVRATETMIHKYYTAVTRQTPRRKDRNWGAYVRNLNTHKKKDPDSRVDAKLVSLIDQVREHHRNPVMHPEITLNADEAQSLFSICQAVIITFANALKALSDGTQLTLQPPTPGDTA